MRRWVTSVLRGAAATGVLGAAVVFAWRDSWPWHRLQLAMPMTVSTVFTETLDTLHRGETISDLFARHGVRGFTPPGLPTGLSLDPRRLRAGLVFSFRRELTDSIPSRVVVRTGPERRIRFERAAEGWSAFGEAIPWRTEVVRLAGSVENSLYEALDHQVPDTTLTAEERVRLAWDLADIYAWQVDFTRDIRPGDRFDVLVERLVSEEGDLRFGRVLAGDLMVGGRELTAFRFDAPDGRSGFYDASGLSLRRAFLRAPVQFRRISSRFSGGRLHPILGTVRRHEGTDYAADPGTPVMAAGDGVVLRVGWTGGYGNMVELRHRSGITTRYGHLERFTRGLHVGQQISQGAVIGYVGSTGLATGPHLHYEFRVNGIARDSRSVNLGSGRPVPPTERVEFDRERARLEALLGGPTAVLAGTSD